MTTSKILCSCLLLVLTGAVASAQDQGAAKGTLTVNRQATELRYVYARRVQNQGEKRIRLVISDAPVSDDDLKHPSTLADKAQDGMLQYLEVLVDLDGEMDQVSLHGEPFGNATFATSNYQFKATRLDAKMIAGKAWTVQPYHSSLSNADWEYNVTFSAQIDAPAGKAFPRPGAGTAPSSALQPGTAQGKLQVADKETLLRYAAAREQQDIFDRTKRQVRIVLSDAPIDRKSTRLNSSHIQKSRMPSSA